MHIEFDFTEQDFMDFNLYHFAHSPTERRALWVGRLLTSLLTTLLILGLTNLFLRPIWDDDASFRIWLPVLAVVMGIVAFVIYGPSVRRESIKRIRKLLREGDNSAVFGPETLTLSEEGIFEQDRLGERRYNWSAIQRMVENGKHIFLYVSATKALVIPTRAFASEAMKQEFLQLVKTHSKAVSS